MKRQIMALFTACLTLWMLLLCSGCSWQTKALVKDINKNCNLEIKLLTLYDDGLFGENYERIPGFGITGYFDTKYGEGYGTNCDAINACSVIYHVSSYPDAIFGKQYVTRIDITDPTIEVYDFSVGDNATEMQDFLFDKGFEKFDDGDRLKKYRKDGVQIRIGINYEEQTINSIALDVDTINILGVIY